MIAPVFAAYRDAVFAKDVDAFVALYDRDVRVFDLWGVWSYDGIDAWRRAVAGWFGSLGGERVGVVFSDERVHVHGDLAIVDALVTYRSLDLEGREQRAMLNRLTWALKRTGDVWTIVHEHTSAPVDFETAKAMLIR